jgi:23S rRNA (uridine2552-2'-O)-methyltransferase|tara:strand:+ start:5250 stop:5861 length:612 start_codon:yes stop_codon:yes gene_type:complete
LKKNKISKEWIKRQRRDIYVRKSKQEGFRSRAVYKLQEINDKHKIIKNGFSVIDLGAAPGGWSQYIIQKFRNCKLLSIDLKEMEPIGNSYQIVGDFNESSSKEKIINYFKEKVDLVMSDMAVNTTGNKNLDSVVTGELSLEALRFSKGELKPNGSFISKIFMGSTFNEIVDEAKLTFKEINIFKPPSSRKESKESFIICKKLR